MSRKSNVQRVASQSAGGIPHGRNAPSFASDTAVDNLWLYRLVFRSAKIRTLFALLVCSFILQPLDVEAEELVDVPAETINEAVVAELALPPAESNSTPEPDEMIIDPEPSVTEVTESDPALTTPESTATAESVALAVETPSAPEDVLDLSAVTTTTVPVEQVQGSSTPENSPTPLPEEVAAGSGVAVDAQADETESSVDRGGDSVSEVSSDTASTTANEEGEGLETEFIADAYEYDPLVFSMVESDAAFTFGRDECTRIDGGAFFCQERTLAPVLEDSLAALPDRDGDLEIYLTLNGVQTKITDNTYDDSAPFYDEHSETIVWQQLVGDTYQIVSYDIDSGDEVLLTSGTENNMEPARHGRFTVWQRWLDDNWEIILFDGTQELRVTNSPEHDIAPSIRGSLLIWNTQTHSGNAELRTFDFKTNTRDVIRDSDGVAVGNPRMVVMYEAQYENGDVVTKGYDLVSGELIPLHSLPKPLPQDIPAADKTEGETSALIQSKPSVKEDLLEIRVTSEPEPTVDDDVLDLRTASSSVALPEAESVLETHTLIITPLEETAIDSLEAETLATTSSQTETN